MSKSIDPKYKQTFNKLIALGYAPTSATNPQRLSNYNASYHQRASEMDLWEHPVAVYTYPHDGVGCDLPDALNRQLVLFTITAYQVRHRPTLKAIEATLKRFKLAGGPVCRTAAGDVIRPFKYGGEKRIFDCRVQSAHPRDELAVVIRHAIDQGPAVRANSYTLPLAGEWSGGDLLTVPRAKLPQLFANVIEELLEEIAIARWDCRPAASAKGNGEDEGPLQVCDVDNGDPRPPAESRPGWTAEKDETLRREYAPHREEGRLGELAGKLGVDINALHNRAHRLGVSKPIGSRRQVAKASAAADAKHP